MPHLDGKQCEWVYLNRGNYDCGQVLPHLDGKQCEWVYLNRGNYDCGQVLPHLDGKQCVNGETSTEVIMTVGRFGHTWMASSVNG